MAQKNASPTREQAAAIKHAGFNPKEWVVAAELVHILFIRHRVTGEVKVIDK